MKKRFLACVLASALLLMGTGYAYWTNTFTLNGHVTTGNLSVKLTDGEAGTTISDYTGSDSDKSSAFRTSRGGITTSIHCNSRLDSINFALSDMYPGYGQTFTFEANNFGTVAAKLSSIGVTANDFNAQLKKEIGLNIRATINNMSWEWQKTGTKVVGTGRGRHTEDVYGWVLVNNPQDVAQVPATSEFAVAGKGFTSLTTLAAAGTISADNTKFLFLDTCGNYHSATIEVTVAMDPDAAGLNTTGTTWKVSDVADSYTQGQDKNFSLAFNWDQYNATKPAETDAE